MQVRLDRTSAERVRVLARAWGTTPEQALARLLEDWIGSSSETAPSRDGLVRVHMEYRGHRAEGLYDPARKKVQVVHGPGAAPGTYFKPSPAAIAVVQAVAPDVDPNRNGWKYWIITDTGEPLQSIRWQS